MVFLLLVILSVEVRQLEKNDFIDFLFFTFMLNLKPGNAVKYPSVLLKDSYLKILFTLHVQDFQCGTGIGVEKSNTLKTQ